MTSSSKMTKIDTIKEYFRRIDLGELAAELFTADFEFFYPKFGVGRGPEEFYELAKALGGAMLRSAHRQDSFMFVEAGNNVAVEGTTEGTDINNLDWCGGKLRGGRFCSVFVFNGDGLIERMYIYVDPDYTGLDKDRFRWPAASRAAW